MSKVTNIFFGIGVAVLVYVVVLLGVQAFYHEKSWEDYNCTYPIGKEFTSDLQGCTTNMTVGQCLDYRNNRSAEMTLEQAEYDECNTNFQNDMKIYNKNLFLITAIIGALAIVLSTLFIRMTNISVGISFAGLALIIYGFARGWNSTGDSLKFIIAIVIAAIIIWLGVRYSNRK